jgi:hypothetical protein
MKPLASLSLDLDNKWTYLKTHGDPGWEAYPTYLPLVVPRVLDFLAERRLTITFFVVGQDAARAENQASIRAIADAGHEIGNHSFQHEPWLHLYTEPELEADLAAAEASIEQVTGRRPIGFRGPGFSHSPATLRVLARRGYLYDASSFPTFLGPLARAYYFMTARLSAEERQQRRVLFGTFRDGLKPLKLHRLATAAGPLVEIPVTTLPGLRTPIHFSYLLYLGQASPRLAAAYFARALQLCRWTGTQPSLLLHPLDFLGGDDVSDLAFFPAMGVPRARKLALVDRLLRLLTAQFDVVTMRRHAQTLAQPPCLRVADRGIPSRSCEPAR